MPIASAVAGRQSVFMTLKTRILSLILTTQLLLIALLALGSLDRLRDDIAADSRIGAQTARHLVLATIGTMQGAMPPDRIMALLPERLTEPPNARVVVLDARTGTPRRPAGTIERSAAAPAWFYSLVAPEITESRLPVVIGGRPQGFVLIAGDPAGQIQKAWRDMRDLMALALGIAGLQALLVWWAVSHALRPVGVIGARLAGLCRSELDSRIGPLPQTDLAPLAHHVDRLADTLAQAHHERRRLQHQIVARADAERKAIARDLHDEMGPCLFGLRVEADALATAAPDQATARSASQIAAIAEQISQLNRNLLNDLRPMAVGQLPLETVLGDFVQDLERRFPDICFDLDIAAGMPEPDEATTLTLFRILQEGTTNALRHAGASRVAIRLWTDPAHWRMILTDNGKGMDAPHREGTGLTGMRERITLLGGDLQLTSGGDGTQIQASLPRPDAI